MSPDNPPSEGEAEVIRRVIVMDELDHPPKGQGPEYVIMRYLGEMRREMPYATELVLTLRWRAGG